MASGPLQRRSGQVVEEVGDREAASSGVLLAGATPEGSAGAERTGAGGEPGTR